MGLLGMTQTSPDERSEQNSDAITGEIIQNAFQSAADQMKMAMVRTAFSPIIYDGYDFAAGLYDRHVRLLSQSTTLPLFLGTMDVCIRSVLEKYKEDGPKPGDIFLLNYGYETGAHGNDMVIVIPGFRDGELVAYAVVKAHMMDVRGKNAITQTDSTDIWQEGVIFPTVRLYRAGVRDDDIYKMLKANSRMPVAMEGDINAMISAANTGLGAIDRIIERYGLPVVDRAVDLMCDRGEAQVREVLSSLPDGRWSAPGTIDGNGITPDQIDYNVTAEIDGDEIIIDLKDAPPQSEGPINNPRPSTVSTVRAMIMGFVGVNERLNEGHFRPVKVLTRAGTIFHAEHPAPIGIYAFHLPVFCDALFIALGQAVPERVTAGGSDIGGILAFGVGEDGTFWGGGFNLAGGQGASLAHGDGGPPLMHLLGSGSRLISWEVWEARFPMRVEWSEYDRDTGGIGRYRGGLGSTHKLRALTDMFLTVMIDRVAANVPGLQGGGDARHNTVRIHYPNGDIEERTKATFPVPKGALLEIVMAGGGGCGDADRPIDDIRRDIENDMISPEAAERDYRYADDDSVSVGGA